MQEILLPGYGARIERTNWVKSDERANNWVKINEVKNKRER